MHGGNCLLELLLYVLINIFPVMMGYFPELNQYLANNTVFFSRKQRNASAVLCILHTFTSNLWM